MSHRVITEQIAQPAAGGGFAFTPSNTDKTLLLAVTAKLTTSAAVANRRPALALEDLNGLLYWSADAGYAQAASLGVVYSWARGVSMPPPAAVVSAERVALGLPWLRLQPGDTVNALTVLEDAADQWSLIVWRGIIGDWWEDEQELAYLAQALATGAAG